MRMYEFKRKKTFENFTAPDVVVSLFTVTLIRLTRLFLSTFKVVSWNTMNIFSFVFPVVVCIR